nr:MAG TPA: hypothetical protein [Caudoviricetes sp.]
MLKKPLLRSIDLGNGLMAKENPVFAWIQQKRGFECQLHGN